MPYSRRCPPADVVLLSVCTWVSLVIFFSTWNVGVFGGVGGTCLKLLVAYSRTGIPFCGRSMIMVEIEPCELWQHRKLFFSTSVSSILGSQETCRVTVSCQHQVVTPAEVNSASLAVQHWFKVYLEVNSFVAVVLRWGAHDDLETVETRQTKNQRGRCVKSDCRVSEVTTSKVWCVSHVLMVLI